METPEWVKRIQRHCEEWPPWTAVVERPVPLESDPLALLFAGPATVVCVLKHGPDMCARLTGGHLVHYIEMCTHDKRLRSSSARLIQVAIE